MIFRVLIASFVVLMGASAQACGVYDTATQRHWVQQQRGYLAYADKVIRGSWKETSRNDEAGDMTHISGVLIPDAGGEPAAIQLDFFPEINCGFPAFPSNGDHGKFYLRAQDISPGDYQAGHVSYGLLHFVSDRKRS